MKPARKVAVVTGGSARQEAKFITGQNYPVCCYYCQRCDQR